MKGHRLLRSFFFWCLASQSTVDAIPAFTTLEPS